MKHLHFSTFRLFDFSKLKMRPFHFLTFQLFDFFRLFEIQYETFPLFNFSTFRLLEILFALTYFPTEPCSVFFQPRRISPYIGGKTMDKPMNSGGLFPSADGMRLNSGSFSRVNLVRERLSSALRVCKASASHWGLMI